MMPRKPDRINRPNAACMGCGALYHRRQPWWTLCPQCYHSSLAVGLVMAATAHLRRARRHDR